MGNWRTVRIVGTCDPKEVPAVKAECQSDNFENWHCLSYQKRGSMCGVNEWPAAQMDVTGNLSERDYTVDDVFEQCKKLAAVAPSLAIKIHCGGDYEDKKCIATVAVDKGAVAILPPQVQELDGIDDATLTRNLFKAIGGVL